MSSSCLAKYVQTSRAHEVEWCWWWLLISLHPSLPFPRKDFWVKGSTKRMWRDVLSELLDNDYKTAPSLKIVGIRASHLVSEKRRKRRKLFWFPLFTFLFLLAGLLIMFCCWWVEWNPTNSNDNYRTRTKQCTHPFISLDSEGIDTTLRKS